MDFPFSSPFRKGSDSVRFLFRSPRNREVSYLRATDLRLPPPFSIAPRRLRIGVAERIDMEGRVVIPLDEAGIRAANTDSFHKTSSIGAGLRAFN